MPRVSVCIPTYNGSTYLKECLDSIISQTFKDIEILIVDDHSADNCIEIAQSYADQDNRFRIVINDKNLGLVRNWNQCVLLSRGEWIKFLFQDDLLEPNCIEKMLSVCCDNTEMVVCKRQIIFEDDTEELKNEFYRYIENHNMDKIFDNEKEISAEMFCCKVLDNMVYNFIGEPTAVMLNRRVFYKYGMFNPNLISLCDLEYWLRVGTNSGLVYIPEILAQFRRHRKGATFIDEKSRRFRMQIDNLVCLHEFIFNPIFKQLRYYAENSQPAVNLNQIFASRVKAAYKKARRIARNRKCRNTQPLEELKEISLLYAGFKIIKKIPLSLRLAKYRCNIRNIFISQK